MMKAIGAWLVIGGVFAPLILGVFAYEGAVDAPFWVIWLCSAAALLVGLCLPNVDQPFFFFRRPDERGLQTSIVISLVATAALYWIGVAGGAIFAAIFG